MNNSEECLCCCDQKIDFKNYGCQHKICMECHTIMNNKDNRKTCLYCDPLQKDKISIDVLSNIEPIQNIVIEINVTPYRSYLFDVLYFVFSCGICCILGFIVFNLYFYFDSNLDKKEITNFDNFSLNKSFFGIIYICIFIYLIITCCIILAAIYPENRNRYCNRIFDISLNIRNKYFQIKYILCCIT